MVINCNYEVFNELYHQILDITLNYCNRFQFVLRNDFIESNQNYLKLLDILEKYLIDVKESNKWPGTELLVGKSLIFQFQLNVHSIKLLKTISDNIEWWVHPNAPEDLCFLQTNGNEFLTTITHENDAYFNINKEVYETLKNNFPNLFEENQ